MQTSETVWRVRLRLFKLATTGLAIGTIGLSFFAAQTVRGEETGIAPRIEQTQGTSSSSSTSGSSGTGPSIEKMVSGTIACVDPQAKTITLEGKKDLIVPATHAYISRDGREAELKDLRPGDELEAKYISGDRERAMRIETRSGGERPSTNQ